MAGPARLRQSFVAPPPVSACYPAARVSVSSSPQRTFDPGLRATPRGGQPARLSSAAAPALPGALPRATGASSLCLEDAERPSLLCPCGDGTPSAPLSQSARSFRAMPHSCATATAVGHPGSCAPLAARSLSPGLAATPPLSPPPTVTPPCPPLQSAAAIFAAPTMSSALGVRGEASVRARLSPSWPCGQERYTMAAPRQTASADSQHDRLERWLSETGLDNFSVSSATNSHVVKASPNDPHVLDWASTQASWQNSKKSLDDLHQSNCAFGRSCATSPQTHSIATVSNVDIMDLEPLGKPCVEAMTEERRIDMASHLCSFLDSQELRCRDCHSQDKRHLFFAERALHDLRTKKSAAEHMMREARTKAARFSQRVDDARRELDELNGVGRPGHPHPHARCASARLRRCAPETLDFEPGQIANLADDAHQQSVCRFAVPCSSPRDELHSSRRTSASAPRFARRASPRAQRTETLGLDQMLPRLPQSLRRLMPPRSPAPREGASPPPPPRCACPQPRTGDDRVSTIDCRARPRAATPAPAADAPPHSADRGASQRAHDEGFVAEALRVARELPERWNEVPQEARSQLADDLVRLCHLLREPRSTSAEETT